MPDVNAVNLTFTENFGPAGQALVGKFNRTLAQIEAAGNKSSGGFSILQDEAEHLVEMLGSQVPKAVGEARASLARGLVPAGSKTKLIELTTGVLGDLGKIEAASKRAGTSVAKPMLDSVAQMRAAMNQLARDSQRAAAQGVRGAAGLGSTAASLASYKLPTAAASAALGLSPRVASDYERAARDSVVAARQTVLRERALQQQLLLRLQQERIATDEQRRANARNRVLNQAAAFRPTTPPFGALSPLPSRLTPLPGGELDQRAMQRAYRAMNKNNVGFTEEPDPIYRASRGTRNSPASSQPAFQSPGYFRNLHAKGFITDAELEQEAPGSLRRQPAMPEWEMALLQELNERPSKPRSGGSGGWDFSSVGWDGLPPIEIPPLPPGLRAQAAATKASKAQAAQAPQYYGTSEFKSYYELQEDAAKKVSVGKISAQDFAAGQDRRDERRTDLRSYLDNELAAGRAIRGGDKYNAFTPTNQQSFGGLYQPAGFSDNIIQVKGGPGFTHGKVYDQYEPNPEERRLFDYNNTQLGERGDLYEGIRQFQRDTGGGAGIYRPSHVRKTQNETLGAIESGELPDDYRARALLRASKGELPSEHVVTTNETLYRGIGGHYADRIAALKPGEIFSEGLSSFSSKQDVAQNFGPNILELLGGAKGIKTPRGDFNVPGETDHGNFDFEHETIAGGRFEVLKSVFDETLNGGSGAHRITLRALENQFATDEELAKTGAKSGLTGHAVDDGGSGRTGRPREGLDPELNRAMANLVQGLSFDAKAVLGNHIDEYAHPDIPGQPAAYTQKRFGQNSIGDLTGGNIDDTARYEQLFRSLGIRPESGQAAPFSHAPDPRNLVKGTPDEVKAYRDDFNRKVQPELRTLGNQLQFLYQAGGRLTPDAAREAQETAKQLAQQKQNAINIEHAQNATALPPELGGPEPQANKLFGPEHYLKSAAIPTLEQVKNGTYQYSPTLGDTAEEARRDAEARAGRVAPTHPALQGVSEQAITNVQNVLDQLSALSGGGHGGAGNAGGGGGSGGSGGGGFGEDEGEGRRNSRLTAEQLAVQQQQAARVLQEEIAAERHVAESARVLANSQTSIARQLDADARFGGGSGGGRGGRRGGGGNGEQPEGFGAGLAGGLFGHGFASQEVNPSKILGNLGSTLGIVARYSAESEVYQGIVDGLKTIYDETQKLAEAMIHLDAVQHAVGSSSLDLNEAFSTGAEYGLGEADAINAGIGGLQAYRAEIAQGANASDIFNDSVKQTGIAMLLTGQNAEQARAQLTAVTQEFQLGSAGQGRVNDALASVGAFFNVNKGDLLQGLGAAGDLADVGGFSVERLTATLGAVQQATGQNKSAQISRDLSQGGSQPFRNALANLGVQYNAADFSSTLYQAGEAYEKLTDAQRTNFAVSLGGARTAETVIALLKQQKSIVEATDHAYEEGGKAIEETSRLNRTLGGELRQLGGIGKEIAADLGKSGLLDFFGVLLSSIKPVLQTFDDLLKVTKNLGGDFLGGHGVGSLVVPALLVRGLAGFGGGAGLLGRSASSVNPDGTVTRNRGAFANARRGTARLFGRLPAEGAANTVENEHTTATTADTQAVRAHSTVTTAAADTQAASSNASTAAAAALDRLAAAALAAAGADGEAATAANTRAGADLRGADAASLKAGAELRGAEADNLKSGAELRGAEADSLKAGAEIRGAEADTVKSGAEIRGAEADTIKSQAELRGAAAAGAGGAARAGGGFGLPGFGTIAIGAIIAGVIADQIVHAVGAVNEARRASNDATKDQSVTTKSDDLRGRAKVAQEAAATEAEASRGFFGTIGDLFTGGKSGDRERNDKELAKSLNDLATAQDKIRDEAQGEGRYGQLDVSTPEAISASLEAMKKSGASAKEQLDELNKVLDSVALNGEGARRALLPVDQQILGATSGASVPIELKSILSDQITQLGKLGGLNAFLSNPDDPYDEANSFAEGLSRADGDQGEGRIALLQAVDPDEANKLTTNAVSAYLAENPDFDPNTDQKDFKDKLTGRLNVGLTGFKALDEQDKQAIVDQVYNSVANSLKEIDYSKVSPGALVAVLESQAATSKTVSDQIVAAQRAGHGYSYTDAGTKQLDAVDKLRAKRTQDQKDLDAASAAFDRTPTRATENRVKRLTDLVGEDDAGVLAAQTAYDQADKAYGDKNSGESPDVAGARAYLKSVTDARDKAVKQGNLTPDRIRAANKLVDDAQNGLNTALAKQFQDQTAIDSSKLALSDTIGRANAKYLNDLKAAKLLHGYERVVANAANAEELQQIQQQTAQSYAGRISVGEVQINPSSGQATEGNALDYDPRQKLTNAQRELSGDQVQLFVIAQQEAKAGLTHHTQAYIDLFKKIQQDNLNVAQISVDLKNAALSAATDPSSAVSQAQTAYNIAVNNLSLTAPGTAERDDAQAQVNATKFALRRANVDELNANIGAAADPRSQVDSATTSIAQALNTMRLYRRGSAEWAQAQQQLKQGYVSLIAAQVEDAKNIFLLGGDQTDPVTQAAAEAKAAADKLNIDRNSGAKPDVIRADTLASNSANQARERAATEQFFQDNQTNYDLHRIGFTEYLQNLEKRRDLLVKERAGLKKGTQGYRQLTDLINEADKSILDASNSLQGQFNLGDIKVPTVYEVRRQNATAQAGVGYSDNRVTSIVINGIGSTQEVVQIVKQQLGTSATVNRAPVATRKK